MELPNEVNALIEASAPRVSEHVEFLAKAREKGLIKKRTQINAPRFDEAQAFYFHN